MKNEVIASKSAPKDLTSKDLNMLRDVAFSLPASHTIEAISLLELALKHKPHGGRIRRRIRELKAELSERVGSAQINVARRLMFIHIPQCCGELLERSGLFEHLASGHESISSMRSIVGASADRYRALVLIRNPWSRLVSVFHYLAEGGNGSARDKGYKRDYVDAYGGELSLFLRAFVSLDVDFNSCIYLRPAVSFVRPSTSPNRLLVQQVESLVDFQLLSDFTGYNFQLDLEAFQQPFPERLDVFNQKLFDGVAELYAEDILEFGYSDYTLADIVD